MNYDLVNTGNTVIIFFPFDVKKISHTYLYGYFESFDNTVKIFLIIEKFETYRPEGCVGSFKTGKSDFHKAENNLAKNWICLDFSHNVLSLQQLKIEGSYKDLSDYHVIWINYDFKAFSQCEIPSSSFGAFNDESYFKCLKEKINIKVNSEKREKKCVDSVKSIIISVLSVILFQLSYWSKKLLPVTKYFNIAIHMDSFLSGLYWAVQSAKEKKKFNIKILNLLSSAFLDMLLGMLILKWLSSTVLLDSFPNIFLLTTKSLVNSIKELINWLKGDPAGLKLNWALNKILAAFFSFHIDLWWTFISFLKPVIDIIFIVFLKLGLLGFTFQASIITDLLALVSFHVYCIYAYATKLYSIQVSSLISLWRLFLGRKKNPFRKKVDSCVYSPEQLFVGTLGFTILLFLLPTTLLYYVVFTCIRLLILMIGAVLMLIRFLSQTMPVYSTILWIMRSPKIYTGVEVMPYNDSIKSNFILLNVKPVVCSWWESVTYFKPDCVAILTGFKLSEMLSSLISGKLIYPI